MGLVTASAAPPPGYYDSAVGKTGLELKLALHDIIDDHHVIPYSSSSFDTQDALEVLDQDPANTNNVILIYSQRSEPKANWPGWNREHLWPNSYGIDDRPPAYSDLHNLRACDANVNSARGNEFFDWSDTNAASYAMPAHVEAPACSSDADSWEPPASERGDIARVQFYMAVRYAGDKSNESDLELTDDTQAITSSSTLMGRLSTLLQWHRSDPVDDAERLRNDRVYSLYQTNRNPFVDHPEWVQAVFVPRLAIEPATNGVRLRWAANGPAMQLRAATNAANGWFPVPGTPELDGQGWYLDRPAEDPAAYYRLELQ